jgi:peptide/nickel transport system permease protein
MQETVKETAQETANAPALPAKAPPPEGNMAAVASQWQLMWWKFRKNRLAVLGLIVGILFYLLPIFAEFVAPRGPQYLKPDYVTRHPNPSIFFLKAVSDLLSTH